MSEKQKFYIDTFGCQMNVHDSEKIAGVMNDYGYSLTNDPKEADLIIYNTCSIRQKAEQKFYSELGRVKSYKKRNPSLKIAVAGCIAQQQGKEIFRRAPHVDIVFGPQNIHLLPDLIKNRQKVAANHDNQLIAEHDLPAMRNSGCKAWVSIMYGCDNFCSYCIVPYTRGRERSRPSENILREIKELAEKGFKEVTLLGQNVNSYTSDTDFPGLLRMINRLNGIERIRFVTSHPRDLSDALMSAISELEKVCECLHLPMQTGSTRVLGLMNRGYTYNEYRKKVVKLKDLTPDMSITTDIIAGFPGETEDDHKQSVDALREIEFDGIFAFKYSPRPGTVASDMEGQLDEKTKSARLAEILDVQDSITLKTNNKINNTIQEILVEGPSETDESMLTGRTRTNKVVNFKGDKDLTGNIINLKITEVKRHSFTGVIL
ncbi:MAG: tRNA (N6-isopentenyl adenosine(37)-C2)-methylthiotransferase MiaB [Nitrospirota bacterium]